MELYHVDIFTILEPFRHHVRSTRHFIYPSPGTILHHAKRNRRVLHRPRGGDSCSLPASARRREKIIIAAAAVRERRVRAGAKRKTAARYADMAVLVVWRSRVRLKICSAQRQVLLTLTEMRAPQRQNAPEARLLPGRSRLITSSSRVR